MNKDLNITDSKNTYREDLGMKWRVHLSQTVMWTTIASTLSYHHNSRSSTKYMFLGLITFQPTTKETQDKY